MSISNSRQVDGHRIRIAHLISGLGVGGAERTLQSLVGELDKQAYESVIISLSDLGVIGEELRKAGYQVIPLGWRSGAFSPNGFLQLIRIVRKVSPGILQTWMYHADFLGALLTYFMRGLKLYWNVRGTISSMGEFSWTTQAVIRACSLLSGRPDGVIVNSKQGEDDHRVMGYSPKRWMLIRNGIDPQRFKPSRSDRESLRQNLQISDDAWVIGCVARYHPKKGHRFLIQSFAHFAETQKDSCLVLIGHALDESNVELVKDIQQAGIADRVFLLGTQIQSEFIYPALDALAMPSQYGEGFPNVVAEAMSCGVPCVVTDVGDAAFIVGETGEIVSQMEVQAFSNALASLRSRQVADREGLSRAARDRILKNFHIDSMVKAYQDLYSECLNEGDAA